MGGMFHVAVGVAAVIVEEVVALPAGVGGVVAEGLAAGATEGLAVLHLVEFQVVLVAEVLVLHFFFLFSLSPSLSIFLGANCQEV